MHNCVMVVPMFPLTYLEQVHRTVKHDPLCPGYSNSGCKNPCCLAALLAKRLKPL